MMLLYWDEGTVTKNHNIVTDRRTVLQTSGVAAGAGTAGLLGNRVTADATDDHYLVASDFHFGSPLSEVDAIRQFLDEEVPARDPDVLVLAGDIYELWFRGMASVMMEFSEFSLRFEELHRNGTEVVLVAGNHDRRLIRNGEAASDDLTPPAPWIIGEEYVFESGDTEFVAVHGDGADIIQRDPLSEWLCLRSDYFGSLWLGLGGLIGIASAGETGSVSVEGETQSLSLSEQYTDPIVVSGQTVDGSQPVASATQDTADIEVDGNTGDTLDYLVLERGRHVLGGETTAVADRTTADDSWTRVTFDAPLETTPVVFPTVEATNTSQPVFESLFASTGRLPAGFSEPQSDDGGFGSLDDVLDNVLNSADEEFVADPVPDTPVVQVRNVTRDGFDVRLQSGTATVSYVAIEQGWGGVDDGIIEVGTVSDITGTATVDGIEPSGGVLAAPQTADDESATMVTGTETRDGIELAVTDTGSEASAETVGYLAFEGEMSLTVTESSALESGPFDAAQAEWEQVLEEANTVDVEDLPDGIPIPDGVVDEVPEGLPVPDTAADDIIGSAATTR